MDDITKAGFLEMVRQLVWYTDMQQDRKDYFLDILTNEKFSQMTSDDAGELMMALPKAQEKLEKMVIEGGDSEKIYALANLKSFTYELLNNSEEQALNQVLEAAGGSSTSTTQAPSKDGGEWLLNKLAGLSE